MERNIIRDLLILKQMNIKLNFSELARIYQEDKAAYPVKFRSLTDFLIQYQDCIFCHRQLVNLLELIGVDNPESRARNHKKRYGIEYFSKSDLKKAVDEIKRATEKFFSE